LGGSRSVIVGVLKYAEANYISVSRAGLAGIPPGFVTERVGATAYHATAHRSSRHGRLYTRFEILRMTMSTIVWATESMFLKVRALESPFLRSMVRTGTSL
jgi:hypothetical protein